MTKRNPEFDGFSAYFAVRAETDRKGKSTPPARTETAMCEPVDWIYSDFNPLRPRGRRLRSGDNKCLIIIFQPTPPTRTETAMSLVGLRGAVISTHSAHEDGDYFQTLNTFPMSRISTHSAHEDGDSSRFKSRPNSSYFNPLRPRGRRPV